jgi:hemin uptake protein HemP
MSNLTYHGAKNMCRIVQDVRTLVSQTLRETTGRVIFGPNEI